MAYCSKCDREVGIEKSSRAIVIFGCLILGVIVPLWIITLPIFWGIAFITAIIPRKRKCGVCKSPIGLFKNQQKKVVQTG